MKADLILVGGGGHCRACIEVIETQGIYGIAGIVDAKEKRGTKILGYDVIGADDDLPALAKTHRNFFIAVGQIQSSDIRARLSAMLEELGAHLPAIISPASNVSRHAVLGSGSVVMHQAVVNAGASVGKYSIINTAGVVEHDAQIGNYCHISTGAVVNGAVSMGTGCFIGSNAVIREGIKLGDGAIVGAGAVVIADCMEAGTYVGNPARKV